jgi:hypothetical protein
VSLDDEEGTDIPEIPKRLLGPTGKVFIHPDKKNYSTELNIVTELPSAPGKSAIIPLLVPGQKDVKKLLAGEKATDEQYKIAVEYAESRVKKGEVLPLFDKVEHALEGEKSRHDFIASRLEPLMAKYLTGRKQVEY